MQIKIFTIRYSESIDGFDDEPMRRFLTDKKVISVRDRFFIKDNEPYWSVMVVYKPHAPPPPAQAEKSGRAKNEKKDYRDLLNDQNMPLFNRLREWRRIQSQKETLPPYVLFNNHQLAQIAAKEPTTLNALAAIEGVGSTKLERYGETVLQLVADAVALRSQGDTFVEAPAESPEKKAEELSPDPPFQASLFDPDGKNQEGSHEP